MLYSQVGNLLTLPLECEIRVFYLHCQILSLLHHHLELLGFDDHVLLDFGELGVFGEHLGLEFVDVLDQVGEGLGLFGGEGDSVLELPLELDVFLLD